MSQLIMGDALEQLKTIPDSSVDLIITDPPYSLNSRGAGAFGNDHRTYQMELKDADIINGFDVRILDELMRVMKKVNLYVWCNKAQILDYLSYFKDYHYDLICWHKSNPTPVCNNKYLSDTEYLLFFRGDGVKVYGEYKTKHKYYITSTNKADKKLYNHPTVKPLEIIKNLVINSSLEGETVLDCFMGSGTTGVASKQLNRDFIGIEINPEYYQTAVKRIESA